VAAILNERNGRERREGRIEKEMKEAKKRKMSERRVNRITCDSHNKQILQQYPWNDHEKN
jgi:hypothetical protein